jgi:Transmembrane secretion effector
LGLFLKLPDATVDLTPWIHLRLPTILKENPAAADGGPILVTVEYDVDPEQKVPFLKAMHKYERIRRRDGAYRWGIFQDLENPDRYIETFLVDSWAEHARQHERVTRADRVSAGTEYPIRREPPCLRGDPPPQNTTNAFILDLDQSSC